jgi:hypothetical protein
MTWRVVALTNNRIQFMEHWAKVQFNKLESLGRKKMASRSDMI